MSEMREIRFRARNAELPIGWVYGYFFIEKGSCRIINDDGIFKVIAETENQFTGLKDKNGKEIFESDLVDWDGDIYEVRFNDGEWQLFNSGDMDGDRPSLYRVYSPKQSRMIIVGNIYENQTR